MNSTYYQMEKENLSLKSEIDNQVALPLLEQKKIKLTEEDIKKIADKLTKKVDNVSSVLKHEYSDHLPILINPNDDCSAVFEPKTIEKIQGYKKITDNPKQTENIIRQMEEFLQLSIEDRVAYMDRYIEVREITKRECKKDNLPDIMIGQKGVFAKKLIKKYSLLGFYSGHFLQSQEEKIALHNKIGKSNYSTYLFSFKDQKVPVISAFNIGNRMSLFNSPTAYSGNVRDVARALVQKLNCIVLYARSKENPSDAHVANPNDLDLVTYFTRRKVNKGEQLFVDYGMNYWKNKVNNYINITNDELKSAIIEYKRSTIKNKKRR